jgi:hypothetical protein
VGEQAALAAQPVLQQELKDIINAELSEWASLWPVTEWDVINETRANHRIQDLIGWDQMAEWFRIGESNAVLPGCQLLLNEYGVISAPPASVKPTEYTANRDIMMSHLDIIQTNGGPLSRIGFQSRMTRGRLDPQVIYDRLEDFSSAYGLEMVATEFEVRENSGNSFFPDETERAEITEETLTAYYSHPLVSAFTAWTYMTDDDYAMCSYDGTVKLNGLVWYYLHRIRYVTDETLTADVMGEVALRGFKGDYDITVGYAGTNYPTVVTLSSNQSVVITLDDVDLTPDPESYYASWLTGFPTLGSQTNRADNPDGDVFDNGYEYALGGNPTNAADSGYASSYRVVEDGGSSYLEYVHAQRDDAGARGLVYSVKTDTDLLTPPGWTTGLVEIVGTNVNFIPEGFVTVTNRLPVEAQPQRFLNLFIDY